MNTTLKVGSIRCICAFLLAGSAPAFPSDSIDPVALMRASIAHLEKADSIAVDFEVAEEAMLSNGLKIRAYRAGSLALQRTPGMHGFVFTRKGAIVDQIMSFDGQRLYMMANKLETAAQLDAKGSIDDVMDVMVDAGAYLPGRDLLYQDAAEGLLEDTLESRYEGIVPMGSKLCHYTIFRGPDVDWHLWVDQESEMPCKYMITSKWIAGAPEFELTFTNWALNEKIDRKRFALSAPEGFIKLDNFSSLQPEYSE